MKQEVTLLTKDDAIRFSTVKDQYILAMSAAVLVTLLWSTSYILNKVAFQHQIGDVVDLACVADEAFSSKAMG